MKYRYSKFRPEDLDGLDLEELLSKLSDLLLRSGFDDPYGSPYDDQEGVSADALHDAILEALLNGGLLSDEMLERLLGKDWQTADDAEEKIEQLVQQILEKLQHQGYLTSPPDMQSDGAEGDRPGRGRPRARVEHPLRDHRQEPRLPRLPGAARPARLDRPQQRRPPRHARDGDRHRGQRRAEAVPVRRHDEHRRRRDDPARGHTAAARPAEWRWRATRRRRSRSISTTKI